jgi:hypothetical protein
LAIFDIECASVGFSNGGLSSIIPKNSATMGTKTAAISDFCDDGKRFTFTHNYPSYEGIVWEVTFFLSDYEDITLYYKDSFNTTWRVLDHTGWITYEEKLPSYISIKPDKRIHLECPLDF